MSGYRRQILSGVGWTTLQRLVLRLAGVGTFVLLGRLLQPGEIGLATLALAVSGLVSVLADVGLSQYVARVEELDDLGASTAFWLSVGQAVLGALVVLLLAAPLSTAFGHPTLAPLLRALSVTLVFYGLAAVPTAMCVRRLAFRRLAVREIASGLAGGVAGIALAVAGAGAWALVGQTLVQGAVALLLLWVVTPWRPGLAFDPAAARDMVRFSLPMLGIGVVQAVRDRLEQFLLGAIAGVGVLGYWVIATRLLAVLSDIALYALDLVALPVFARAGREEAGFARVFERATAMSAALLTPALVLLYTMSPLLLPLMFGPSWEPAVVPAQILCAAYAIGSLSYFNRTAYVARDRPATDLVLTLGALGTHLLAVVVAGPFGLVPLAVAMVVEAVVVLVVGVLLLRRLLGVPLRVYRRGLTVLGVSLATAILVELWVRAGTLSAWPEALTGVLLAAGVYVGGTWLLCRSLLVELWEDARLLVGARSLS